MPTSLPVKRSAETVMLAVMVLGAAACAAGAGIHAATNAEVLAGFWQGLWHGVISPITFVVSLFTESVSIYEVHNNGNWYDAGFMLGISTVFSSSARSGALAQRRRQERRRAACSTRGVAGAGR